MIHTTYPSITQFQQLVELKDYREPTKKEYVRYVRKLAEHFQCDPATLTEDRIRQYFLFLRQHKHYTRSPMKAAKYALRCFYVESVQVKGWTVFQEVRIAEPQVLPVVLARGEALAGAVLSDHLHGAGGIAGLAAGASAGGLRRAAARKRVRYYGWLAAAAKGRWQRILALLDWQPPARVVTPQPKPLCPQCGGHLSWLGALERAPL